MRKTIYIIMAALTLSVSTFAQQNLRTAYFLDGYTYTYKFNPAFQSERAFLAIPVLGKTGTGLESNVALSSFIYPTDEGNLVTFLSPKVSSGDFLGSLKDYNRMNVNLDVPVFALGFYTGEMFHTIDISARADARAGLPKSLFGFVKEGASNGIDTWNINNIGARADARLELAYGLSYRLNDFIKVGARVKLLIGLMQADLLVDNVNLKLAEDEWSVASQGQLTVNGLLDVDESMDLSAIKYPASFQELRDMKHSLGYAVDLGVSVDFLEYFTASASLLDLGAINWSQGFNAHTPSAEPWTFSGFEDISIYDSNGGIRDQVNSIVEDMKSIFQFSKTDDYRPGSTSISATAHLGLEARMPFYERLSFGVLGTHRFDGAYSWTEGRISANIAPLRVLSASCSYAISDFGNSFGAAVNLHAGGLTIFAGLDSILPLGHLNPQYIPVDNWNTNLTLGLNMTLGAYKGRFPKKTDSE